MKIVGQGRGVQAGKTERKERKAAHLAHGLSSFSFTLTFFHSAHPCSWKRTMCQGKGPQVHVQRAELRQDQADSHSDPFFRNLACSIPILCLLISQWILSSSRPHKHQAVRSVPRKRILDQYFCVFALQGVCLCSLLFCSLLTFTPQKNTRAGQGGVVLHCWGSVLPCRGTHAHEHTRSIPLLRSISKAGRRSVALQWFCLSHEGALTQTILPVCAARRLAR